MKEEWKMILEYPNYMISNTGKIKNITTGYITKGRNSGARRYYDFCFPDKKEIKVHRLVAKYFCEGYFEGAVVNHKDKNTYNNIYSNLEWTTIADNNSSEKSDGGKKGREATRKRVGMFSLSGELIKEYEAVRDTSKDGFNHRAVSEVCNGARRKTHKGYIWRFI